MVSRTYIVRAAAYAYMKKMKKALEDIEAALNWNKSDPLSYLNRSALLILMGRFKEAEADAGTAISLDPKLAGGYSYRAAARFRLNLIDACIRDATEAIRLDPNDAVAFYHRGMAYEMRFRLESCRKDLTRALALAKTRDVDGLEGRGSLARAIRIKLVPELAYYFRGTAFTNLERYREGAKDLTRGMKGEGNLVSAALNRGLCYYALGRFDDALEDFRSVPGRAAASKQNRKLAMQFAWNNTGLVRFTLGDVEGARKAYASGSLTGGMAGWMGVLFKNQRNRLAYLGRGVTHFCAKREKRGLDDVDRALKLDPKFWQARLVRAVILRALKRKDESRKEFRTALRQIPPDWKHRKSIEAIAAQMD